MEKPASHPIHPGSEASSDRNWVAPEILNTPSDIQSRLAAIEASCSSSVDIMVKGSFPFDTAETTMRHILERGVRVRCIYEHAAVASAAGDAYLASWRGYGEEQRVVVSVPFRAAVFDRTTVLVPLSSRATSITSLLVIGAGLGVAMAHLFDLLWEQRSSYAAPRPLTSQEIEVLTLMCEGMSDQKIARRLQIGVRTVQRRLGELAAAFDAVSRPALAAKAVAAGVVTPFAPQSATSRELFLPKH